MVRKLHLVAIATTALFGVSAMAEITADEAKQLGGPVLTVFGAEKAGNKDGSIPPYTDEGASIKAPPGYDSTNPGNYPDPWNEKPLYTITAQNADKYADKLDGMRELFKKYPNYRMDIYPTHRTMHFPKYVLDNTIKNATSCKGVDGELRLEGCYGGYPFPIPKTGLQVMWNHLLSYEAQSVNCDFESWSINGDGTTVLQNKTKTVQNWPFYDQARTGVNSSKDIYWEVRVDSTAPARKVGEKIVLIDAVDSVGIGRRAYQYVPGQRRVKLAPDIAFDTPSPFGGGAKTMDDSKGFLGSPERYEWKMIGKKEKYIMYNNFKTTDYQNCSADKFTTKNFPNPDCIRWELHRVWVVEGKLKPGYRHIYHTRKGFFDEDGLLAGQVENYDAAGKLYRFSNVVYHPLLNGTGHTGSPSIVMDLQSGAWVIEGLFASKGLGTYPVSKPNDRFFSPEALAGEGIR